VVTLTRRYRLAAAHVLRHRALSDAENERIYGKCANPSGHGHNYGIEVTVAGPVDPTTGAILPAELLDALVAERVLERFDHGMLNDDPLFREAVPTAENLARAIYAELAQAIASRGEARLARVRIVETRRNCFEYGGGG
jgi:6-pyruvoyltetrahydropterin/6-carboxytetrahydropterin synthase